MPTIQSKKYPDNIQFVDSDAWNNFKRLGKDRYFKIIDDGDLQDTVIPTPQVIDFAEPEEILHRDTIKAQLDELVEAGKIESYNTRATTEKLNELLKENK